MHRSLRRSLMLLALASLALALISGCGSSNEASIFHSVKDRATWTSGGLIVFASYGGNGNLYLWTISATGGGDWLITPTKTNQLLQDEGGWQPDQNPADGRLAFVAKRSGNWDIYVASTATQSGTDGAPPVTADPAVDQQPKWSPDGTKIAFASNRTGNYDIWVMNADGSGATQVTTDPGDDQWPYWSPDGLQIAFQSKRSDNLDIYLINADGTGETRLTQSAGDNGAPAWGPTGAILFHTNRSGDWDIYSMTTTPNSETALITDPRSDGFPNWAPGGTAIVFSRQSALWRALPDGTQQKELTKRFETSNL